MFFGPNSEAAFSFTVISDVSITAQKFVNNVGTKFFGNTVFVWHCFLNFLIKSIPQIKLNLPCRYKLIADSSFLISNSNLKMVRLLYMFLLNPSTASRMCYHLAVITTSKMLMWYWRKFVISIVETTLLQKTINYLLLVNILIMFHHNLENKLDKSLPTKSQVK